MPCAIQTPFFRLAFAALYALAIAMAGGAPHVPHDGNGQIRLAVERVTLPDGSVAAICLQGEASGQGGRHSGDRGHDHCKACIQSIATGLGDGAAPTLPVRVMLAADASWPGLPQTPSPWRDAPASRGPPDLAA